MNPVSLLLNPRGAIGHGEFWLGLGVLTAGLAVALGLVTGLASRFPVGELAMALGPVLGPAMLVSMIVGPISDGRPPLEQIPIVLLLCVRLYPLACLCRKRLRGAGRGAGPLVVVGVLSLAVHGLTGWWTYDLWDQEMAVIIPLFADIAANALLWTIFLIWIGAVPARPRKETA